MDKDKKFGDPATMFHGLRRDCHADSTHGQSIVQGKKDRKGRKERYDQCWQGNSSQAAAGESSTQGTEAKKGNSWSK